MGKLTISAMFNSYVTVITRGSMPKNHPKCPVLGDAGPTHHPFLSVQTEEPPKGRSQGVFYSHFRFNIFGGCGIVVDVDGSEQRTQCHLKQ